MENVVLSLELLGGSNSSDNANTSAGNYRGDPTLHGRSHSPGEHQFS